MHILTVVGARPQFIKHAPVSAALSRLRRSNCVETIVHTGQHHDVELSERQFEVLGLRPADVNLGIHGGSPTESLARMLSALEHQIRRCEPDAVLVYGDTTSTLAGALASAGCEIPLVHIEAGLRSFDARMPEERNRVVTDHLSALLLAPTGTAMENLDREGLADRARLVGDVMYDAFLTTPRDDVEAEALLTSIGVRDQEFVLLTLHRAETTSSSEELASRLAFVQAAAGGRPVVLPLHPRTRVAARDFGISFGAFHVVAPVDYRVFAGLLARCALVMTDSGGVQKESYFHRVPCITLRSETEWPETVEAGWNRLWTKADWKIPRETIPDYGQGDAAERCVEVIAEEFG